MKDIPAQAANGLFARNTRNAFRGPVKRGDSPVFVNRENTIGDGIQNDVSVFFFVAWFLHGDSIYPQLSPDSLNGFRWTSTKHLALERGHSNWKHSIARDVRAQHDKRPRAEGHEMNVGGGFERVEHLAGRKDFAATRTRLRRPMNALR
jgi:hypothetical protein